MNRLHAIYLFLFFLVTNSASAFDGVTVHYLGIEQGLSNNAVTCIYQDYNGFMWFGTYDGLNRYDGYSFKIFRNVIGDSNSLGDNHIFSIAADADHNMWIGNLKGISIYNPIKNKFYSPGFIGYNQAGLQYVKEGAGIIRAIHGGAFMMVGTQNNGLLVFEKPGQPGFQVPLVGSSGKKTDYCVASIEYDPSGNTAWIFVLQSGLYKYDIKNKNLELVSAAIKQASCLKADGKGNVWLGNGNGLYRYNTAAGSYSQNFMPAKNLVAGIFADKQNTLWISSDGGGAWYLPPGSDKLYPYLSETGSELINSNVVYDIYVDNDNRKWIATLRGGINIIEPRAEAFKKIIYNIPGQNNIINNFILSFCEDEKRNVWVGTDGAGLRYWDRNKNIFSRYIHKESDAASISSNFITNITKDYNDDIWISTWFGGINRLKKSSQSFEHFTCINPVSGLEENNVWLVYLDKQQRLWASTTNNGTLYLLNRATNKFELFNQSIVNVQCLSEDSGNDFWAGNYTSLYKIDRAKQKFYTYQIGYPVRCIYEDRKKNFWIGTEGGGLLLLNRKTGNYQRFTTSEGLPNNTILRLLEDKKGNLWISTYNGLGKFDPVDKTCKNFSQSDGLQSNQFSFNAALALQSGEFLFGGIKGFNIFYPDSVYNKNESARLFLTGLKINNSSVEENASYVKKRDLDKIESISVPYNQANISLDFIDLQYSGTDKIKYAYLLEGWDKTWSYVNNIRTANYSKLGEGNYTFKIKVTSQDGVWGTEYILLR
ncbi:MAG: two-component regulator propeller domain-containing protein, partial [Chitinophagaceae bacterium]